ncbi:MAG: response regulator [candidate division Zixibacteria bacterium]|nr:response regulator [candidate division Zixibacteria bacterium]
MKKILVIDNSKIIRNLLYDYFTDIGYSVELANNGLEGIEKALSHNYDIVFCDIHMPKRNGFQVYSEVVKEKPELPFIMTDSLPDNLAEKAVELGAYTCLTKPFNLDQLKQTVEKLLVKLNVK